MKHDDAIKAVAMVSEATLRPEFWPDALRQIAICCQATAAHAHMVGPDSRVFVTGRGSEGVLKDYLDGGWNERNSRMERGLALTLAGYRGLITEREMFTPEEAAKDPFQNEFALMHGIEYEAGMVLASHASSSFVINIPRGGSSGPYSADELEPMNRLMAQVADHCAFALRLKIVDSAALAETLGQHGEGLAVLTGSGAILHLTASLERMLGDRLTVRAGRLRAIDPGDDNALQSLISRNALGPTVDGHGPGKVVIRRLARKPLVARCLPVRGGARDILGLACVIVVVEDLELASTAGQVDLLRSAFGLTPAEARLAARVGRGEALREAAAVEDISFETARSRLKTIFLKTDTSRQAELASLVTRLLF